MRGRRAKIWLKRDTSQNGQTSITCQSEEVGWDAEGEVSGLIPYRNEQSLLVSINLVAENLKPLFLS